MYDRVISVYANGAPVPDADKLTAIFIELLLRNANTNILISSNDREHALCYTTYVKDGCFNRKEAY